MWRRATNSSEKERSPMSPKFYTRLITYAGWFIGPCLIYSSMADLGRVRELEASGVVVEARVVDTSESKMYPWSDTEFQVRYAFELGGTTYTGTDEYGAEDIWAPVTPEAFERARTERSLAVRYEPSDPRNNQPVATPPKNIVTRVVGVLGGAACTLLSLGGIAAVLLGVHRKKRAPEAT